MKKQVEEWLNYAKIDLLTVNKLLEDDKLTQSAAFHVQQAVEKTFKALIENMNIRVPKVHDLEKLLGIILENGITIKTNVEMITMLNDIYIETRYPGDQGLVPDGIPSIEFMKKGHSFAEELFNEIYEKLKNELAV